MYAVGDDPTGAFHRSVTSPPIALAVNSSGGGPPVPTPPTTTRIGFDGGPQPAADAERICTQYEPFGTPGTTRNSDASLVFRNPRLSRPGTDPASMT